MVKLYNVNNVEKQGGGELKKYWFAVKNKFLIQIP